MSADERCRNFCCGYCKSQIVDPRLLYCLHSCCLKCLNELSKKSSTGKIVCPICDFISQIPREGIEKFPVNYILQHKILIATLNKKSVRLLCDLCTGEIIASTRCHNCLLNFCPKCVKNHKKIYLNHIFSNLEEKNSNGITQVRRLAMCPSHYDNELKFYCTLCGQVICLECCSSYHKGHPCELSSKAIKIFICEIQKALERINLVLKNSGESLDKINHFIQQTKEKFRQIQIEIDKFTNSYIKVIEEHRKNLHLQTIQMCENQLKLLKSQKEVLEKNKTEAGHISKFGEELLKEGSDFEILSLIKIFFRRLNMCQDATKICEPSFVTPIQFLPYRQIGCKNGFPILGQITTQIASANNSSLTLEGLNALNNCKPQKPCEIKLITKDHNNQPVCHGNENVGVNFKYKDYSNAQRKISVILIDCHNGTYIIKFTPDVSGEAILEVTIKGQPIKGSPFPVFVRKNNLPHKGNFHCCTFCSSGGNKQIPCGCGSKMPGGYRGCGHGHSGHPGRFHWSCCGDINRNSNCNNLSSGIYQFTL